MRTLEKYLEGRQSVKTKATKREGATSPVSATKSSDLSLSEAIYRKSKARDQNAKLMEEVAPHAEWANGGLGN